MERVWHSTLDLFIKKSVFVTITCTVFSCGLLSMILSHTHTKSISPSTWVTHSIPIDDSFKPEPPHFTRHYFFQLEWPLPLLHASLTWGLVTTQGCSICKTLNSNIPCFLLDPWPLGYLSYHRPLLCHLLCQIGLVSMAQRLNPSCAIFWMRLSLLLLLNWKVLLKKVIWASLNGVWFICSPLSVCLADADLHFNFSLECTPH